MLKQKIVFSLFFTLLMFFPTKDIISQSQLTPNKKLVEAMAALDEGKVEQAFNLLKEHYEEAQKSGKEDFQLGNAVNSLGEFYRRINSLEKATTFLTRAIKIAEKISDKSLESAAKNNLGLTLVQQRKFDEAITFFNEALEIRKKVFGEESSEVAITLDNLGIAYANKQDFSKAEEFTKKSLAIFEKEVGISHHDTLLATDNLAQFYLMQGKIADAANLYQKQIDLTEKEFGTDSAKLISPLRQLILIYAKNPDYPKQEVPLRRILILHDKNNIAVYPDKVYYSTLLGYALMKQKKNVEAEKFLQDAVNGIDVKSALKAPDATNLAVSIYVQFLKENNRTNEASALEIKIRKMFEQ